MHGLERGHHPRRHGYRQPDQRREAPAIQGCDSALRISPQQCRSARKRTRHCPRSWNAVSGGTAYEIEEFHVPSRCRHANAGAHGRRLLAASCASTFLLAETGLLDGRRATTTWWFAPLFRQRYPAVELLTEQMVVADWPIATAGAAMAQMDLMLAIVDRFAGPGLAKACANYLLLGGRRSQAPFMAITFLASQDPKIARAEKWVRDNIARDFAIEELAKSVALAPRTFARRVSATCGISPIQFVQRIRLETARFLLETTRLPVDEIARRVGYAEPSTLRRLIRRDTKHPPGHFRPAA